MTITRDNYEPFFLDYLESNLKESMIDEFLDFLEQNPDLKQELHLFENIHLPEEQVVYSEKKHLYKSATEDNSAFELKTIALMEGDLKDDERNAFKAYLSAHPELKKEYDLMAKTRLVADDHIKYPHKKNLYRSSGTILWLNWAARVAAVAFLLWGINALFQNGGQTSSPTLSRQIASIKTGPVAPVKRSEPTVNNPEIVRSEKLAGNVKSLTPNKRKIIKINPISTPVSMTTNSIAQERDLMVPEKIHPIRTSLETGPIENQLAVSHSETIEKTNNAQHVVTLDKFLASRVKRVGDGSLLSANKIIRTGLNVASELSGDRLGYKLKNGKITSLNFESKLMAFSIPLKKK